MQRQKYKSSPWKICVVTMGKLFVLAATAALFLVLFGCAQNAPIPSGIDAQGKQFRGTDGARVTIVEFSDFQCPYCAAAQPTLERLLHEYDGEVKLVYRHYPLPSHPNAQKAAEASECAADEGQFWQMHDAMYANQQSLDAAGLARLAAGIGVSEGSFSTCIESGEKTAKIAADVFDGNRFGVTGTPTFFVNGIPVVGGSYAQLKAAIETGTGVRRNAP